MTSVILAQHNGMDLTYRAIRSFLTFHTKDCEIILVDNASLRGDLEYLQRAFPSIRLIRNATNVGFGRANNQAARIANGEILFLLNNDTLTISEILSPVIQVFAEQAEVGIIGPRLLNLDRSLQLSAGPQPSFARELTDKLLYGMVDRSFKPACRLAERIRGRRGYVGWVTGAALFIRRSLFEELGGFDEALFMYFEDKDLCRRATLLGSRVFHLPEVELVHLRGASSASPPGQKNQVYRRSQLHYYARHRSRLERFLLRRYLAAVGELPE